MTPGNTTRREYTFDGFTVDLERARLLRGGAEVPLRPKAFDALVYLIEHRGRLATKDDLIAALWPNVVVTDDSLVKCVQEVRDALEDKDRRYVKTVPRRGYIFDAPIDGDAPITDEAAAPAPHEAPAAPTGALPAPPSDEPAPLPEPSPPEPGPATRLGARARPRWSVLAAAALGVGAIAGYFLWRAHEPAVENTLAVEPDSAAQAAEKSVAVLPFTSIGDDPLQEYFSDGISEELLHAVAKLPGVRVPSRTSSFAFKSSNTDLATIADALRVSHVLEGSVRRDGDRVRISAQLVDVATDSRIWSEVYDRSLTGIFAVQDEIARSVAAALEVELLGATAAPAMASRSSNLQAHDAYLLGLHHLRTQRSSDVLAAVDSFRRATELDPTFAGGHAWLALALMSAYGYGIAEGTNVMREAEAAAATALELAPNLADVHFAKGRVALMQGDAATADADYRRAIELNPSLELAHGARSMTLGILNRPSEAREALERALELDPLNAYFNWDMGNALLSQSRPDEARVYFRRAVEFLPSQPNAYAGLGDAAVMSGRIDEAVQRYLEGLEHDPGQAHMTTIVGLAYRALNDPERAQEWLERGAGLLQVPALSQLFSGFESLVVRADDPDTLFDLLAEVPNGQFVALGSRLFRKAALRTGDRARVEEFLRARWPELFAADADVHGLNFGAASDVAWILQGNGLERQAEALLLEALDVSRDHELRPLIPVDWALPMFEVEALALLGRDSEALDALRRVIDAGWRWDWWLAETDPTLSSISSDPRFSAMLDEVRADVAAQRERVRQLEQSGEIRTPAALAAAYDSLAGR